MSLVFCCLPSVISPRGISLRHGYQTHWGFLICCKMFDTLFINLFFNAKSFSLVPVEIRSSVKVVPIIWCLLLIGCPNCAVMHWVEREAVGGRACNIQFFTNNVLPWFWRVNSLISKTYLLHICSLPVRRTNCILRNVITHNPEHFTHHGAVHPGIQL